MNTTDPTAPAWATDVGARQVWRSARTNLGRVDLVAQQLPNGEVINARLDLTEIHQVPLADPATDIYELALALMELAQAYMPGLYADIDSLIEAQDRRRLSRRADR